MPKSLTTVAIQDYEQMLHRYIRFHSPVRLFPILESKENLWYFIGQICGMIATRIIEEKPKDSSKGRRDSAFLRGLSWLDKLMWNELWNFPDDVLLSRTARLLGIILHTPGLSDVLRRSRRGSLRHEVGLPAAAVKCRACTVSIVGGYEHDLSGRSVVW